jgi:FkbM family methyltransferase
MSISKATYYLASIWKLLTGFKPWRQVLGVFLRPSIPNSQVVELRKTGIRFNTRNAMDIWTVKETFLDRFYERFGAPIQDHWAVIDIGGGIGDFAILAASGHPGNTVLSFEPTPESVSLLNENLRLNNVTNVQVFPEAIWSRSGNMIVDRGFSEPGQFMTRPVEAVNLSPNTQAVRSISLAEAFERSGLAHCDLLKMDVEGAEFEILFNTPDHILNRIKRFIMEYHDNVTSYNHADLKNFLKEKGFQVKITPNYVHPHLGYLYATQE